jgi:hypothetical protein
MQDFIALDVKDMFRSLVPTTIKLRSADHVGISVSGIQLISNADTFMMRNNI